MPWVGCSDAAQRPPNAKSVTEFFTFNAVQESSEALLSGFKTAWSLFAECLVYYIIEFKRNIRRSPSWRSLWSFANGRPF